MAEAQEPPRVSIDQPGLYCLSGDIRFAGLSRDPDTEKFRIRFSQGPAIILDMLMSGETLGDLIHALTPLAGSVPGQALGQSQVGTPFLGRPK